MHYKWITKVLIVATIIATASLWAEARQVVWRPLAAKEVYAVLKAAGREDAVPEGRHISQGISLATGIALGLTGSMLFNVATANATREWLNSLNYTGLFAVGSGGSSTESPTPTPPQIHEICFKTDRLEYEEPKGSKIMPLTSTTGTGNTPTTTGTTGTGTTPTTSPTTPGTTGGGTATGTGTATTDPNNDPGITCIVIQKPKANQRRRRSLMRKINRRHWK